jgi:hypothetical protein
VDETLHQRWSKLTDALIDAVNIVSGVVEAEVRPTLAELVEARRVVSAVSAQYAELLAATPEAERAATERTHGRRVTDLKRLAAKIPQQASGQAVPRAADAGQPFLSSRPPPTSIEYGADDSPRTATPAYRVGHDVEAWCGPCGGPTEHAVAAMVDGHPKQVVCRSCGARHGFRTGPSRKAAAPAAPTKPTREQLDAKRAADERMALAKELAEATAVRPFSNRERYKAGEIVEHPEHGRGKIETVIRGAIVVRFRDGVRALSLQQ